MHTLSRSKAVALIAAGLVVVGGGVALADNVLSDGDDIAAFSDSNWTVGSVCGGASASKSVPVRVSRQGSATGTNTFANSASVAVSASTASAVLTVESGTKSIALPSNWATVTNGTTSSSVSFQVTYTAPAALGAFSGTVTFSGSGTNADGNTITRTDTMTVSGTVVSCDSTPPVITPTVSGTLGDNGWYTSDVTLTWSVTDAESTITSTSGCGNVSVTSDQLATTYTCSAVSAGGSASQPVTIKRDATAPVVTPGDVTDTTWRNTALSQNFTASDATSDLANSADASFTLEASAESANASTPTTDSRTVKDNAGNSTTRTLSAKIDKTAPSVSYTSASGTSGSNGWYTSEVVATFTALDALSGPASQTDTDSSGAQEGSAIALSSPAFSDVAGNTTAAGAASHTFKVDLTDPDVPTFSSFPSESYATMVPPAPTCSSSDAVSGLAGCVVSGYSTAVGSHTLTATATDNAGRTNTATLEYTVLAWTLKGFYAPVDMNGVWNTVKGGSTVPLKFEIFAGSELTSTGAIKSFTQKTVACPNSTATVDEIEIVTTGGTSLRYDTAGGQFVQNWQTPKKPGTCYQAIMTAQDDSKITANFMLK
jgi:hypothetical protein